MKKSHYYEVNKEVKFLRVEVRELKSVSLNSSEKALDTVTINLPTFCIGGFRET